MSQDFDNTNELVLGSRFAAESDTVDEVTEQAAPRRAIVVDENESAPDSDTAGVASSVTLPETVNTPKAARSILGFSIKGAIFLAILLLFVVGGGGYAMLVGHPEGLPQESISCKMGLNLMKCDL